MGNMDDISYAAWRAKLGQWKGKFGAKEGQVVIILPKI
jgi:hypothetical protein